MLRLGTFINNLAVSEVVKFRRQKRKQKNKDFDADSTSKEIIHLYF